MTDTLGFPRWTEDVTFASDAAWDADYPVTNLGIPPFARVARTINVEPVNTWFRGSFSKPRLTEIIVLCRHNLTLDATWRVRLYEHAADVAPIYDSGFMEAWPPVYGEDEVSWDGGTWWDGKYTDEEIAGYPWYAPHYIPDGYTVEAFRVDVVDPTNPAGYLQFGLCEAASALDLPIGTAFGAQLAFLSRTGITEADGGVETFEKKQKPRSFTGQLAAVARSTSLSRFYEMQRLHDVHRPFFWWPDRTNPKNTLRTAYLARFQQLDPITQMLTAHDALTLSLKEIL
ncbi:MAG: hypothetical protein AB7F35_00545 [Acetobacteraceae bacterium]